MKELAANIIKEFEGFSSKPYLCPANVPTIGYGSTMYKNGERVKMSDPEITEEQATEMLMDTIKSIEKQVKKVLTVKLKPHQMAALVSFTYNVGIGNFSNSTLLAWVNSNPDFPRIPEQFRRWNKGGGKVLQGLVRRREEEIKLWTGERTLSA